MIADNISKIRQQIDLASRRAGRDPAEITLVAVSKTFPAEMVKTAVRAGVADIAESYVQELLNKRHAVNDDSIRWHDIGHLQTNKVKHIVEWVHLIHSVDSLALANEIDKRAASVNRRIDILIEVKTTGEPSKFGLEPDRTVDFVRGLAQFRHIRVLGLMTIGPFLPDPEGSRPMFRRLKLLKDRLGSLDQENVEMKHLSMGMTGDFEVAIEEGATLIRIGTAIFGPRKNPLRPLAVARVETLDLKDKRRRE